MKRFEEAILKKIEEINGRMEGMFGILKELTTSRTPEKIEKEKGVEGCKVAKENVMELNELDALKPIESLNKEEEMEEGTDGRNTFLNNNQGHDIRFEKGTITLNSGKNKIDFVKVPALPSELEKNAEDDLDPITPTNTVSKLILEWEERIKYHQEKEMEFNPWRSMVFDNKGSISENGGCKVSDEGGVMLHMMRISFRVLRMAGDDIAGIKRRRRDLSSDGVRNMATALGRGRLKEDLESSTWKRRQDCKATPYTKIDINYAASENLRGLSAEEAWETIEDCV
ncbi:hypothetical protein Tco_0981155 [Tanacetum coccineum]